MLAFDVTEGTGTEAFTLPAFTISIVGNNSTSSLLDWFSQNVDQSNLLIDSGTYTRTTLPNGTDILLLTGGVPDEWEGGELSEAYAMSPNKARIAIISISQDDPLHDYGFSSQQVAGIVNYLVQTLTFN